MQKGPNSSKQSRLPLTVKITLTLMLVTAVFWFLFSLFVALGGHVSYNQLGVYRWFMAALTFLASIILVVLWRLLRKRFKPAWYFSVLLLAAMILAGFMDELGLIDYAFIVLYLIPITLLLHDRKWYLSPIGKTHTKG